MTGEERLPVPRAGAAAAGTRAAWRRLGHVVGVILLATAVAAVWRQRGTLEQALDVVRRPDPGTALLVLGCIAGNLAATGAMATLLMRRFGRVGILEMQALMAATTLFNYLPLKAGMIGRVAYHQRINGIPVPKTLRVIIEGAAISGLAAAYGGASILVAGGSRAVILWAALAPLPVLAAAGLRPGSRPLAWAALARYADLLLWAMRYQLAFALLGQPIMFHAALAFACVGIMATLLPVGGNGLGVREWAVGLMAPALAGWPIELGVAAELVNRGAELVVAVPVGAAGAAWLWRRGAGARGGGVGAPAAPGTAAAGHSSGDTPRSRIVNSDSNG